MKKTYWVMLIVLVYVVWCIYNFLSGLQTEVYHGRFIDENANQPLVGAVVTVVWYRAPIIQMGGSKYFLSAQETVTDADGQFSLEVSPGLDWDWSTARIKEPAIIFYYPGYEPNSPDWMIRQGYRRDRGNLRDALKSGYVVKLRKLRTQEELRQYADTGYLPLIRVPSWAMPKLLAAINEQRKLLGLDTFN